MGCYPVNPKIFVKIICQNYFKIIYEVLVTPNFYLPNYFGRLPV